MLYIKIIKYSPFLLLADTTPTSVPLNTSSGTVKKYCACSKTGGATDPATTLMFTLALIGTVSPPPSSAVITIVMTELAFPCKERDSEITPVEKQKKHTSHNHHNFFTDHIVKKYIHNKINSNTKFYMHKMYFTTLLTSTVILKSKMANRKVLLQ